MNDATGAVTSLDPELIQVGDAVGQGTQLKQIACQHGHGLRAQELPPCRMCALWRGRDPQPPQHAPYRGRPDPVAQADNSSPWIHI